MKRVLVAYFSLTGNTEKMAAYIAEGVRIAGGEAVVKKVTDIKSAGELAGYDGYIFGSPTYFRDAPEPMKAFLFMARKAGLAGKPGGAFGSFLHNVGYRHDSNAPAIIMETEQYVFNMTPFELGAFNLKEDQLDTSEGMRACQDYGRVFTEKLGS